MKKIVQLLTMFVVLLVGANAHADSGPYYVSYPGYCNVEKVFINTIGDVYGTEVGCTSTLGNPLVGTFTVDGRVIVSQIYGGMPCIAVYGTDGSLRGGCSSGGSVGYNPNSRYAVRESSRQHTAGETSERSYVVSMDMPDISTTKDLPPLR